MDFQYSKQNLSAHDARLQRRLEMLPGATSWTVLITLTLLSIFFPFTAAIFIVAFYLWWLLRLLYMTMFLVLSYLRLEIEQKTDWMARVEGIDQITSYIESHKNLHFGRQWHQWLSHSLHRRELDQLLLSGQTPPSSKDIVHLVIFPVIKEGAEIIGPALEAISRQPFPTAQIMVVFALEDRAKTTVKEGVDAISRQYAPRFKDCFTVVHPSGINGEARVKGANVTYAAKAAAERLRRENIAFENVIVSCFDADTVVDQNYFACLTYHYMVHPDRKQASFQPIPVYHNNIWHVPGFARVIETSSSFFQLIEATNPEKLVTFSSHSMSFAALVDVGYWPVDMISDDSAIFWKCYIHYGGNYRVIPMYVTVSMDVACAETWWRTVKSVYKQKRRWAWGVENFPLVMRGFLKSKEIPTYEKIRHGFKLFEGHVSWATLGFILSIVGWLPIIFARKEFAASVVYYNVPEIANTIFNLGFLCLVISIILSLALLPRPDVRFGWLKRLGMALEWLAVPVILVFLSALPALDAQTRLMVGKYLEFWVTDKHRKQQTPRL